MSYNITEILTSIVDKANIKLSLTGNDAIKFEEGSLKEITDIITLNKRGGNAYPLLWLVTGYSEQQTEFYADYSTDLQLFFVEQTASLGRLKSKEINTGQIKTMYNKIDMVLACLASNKYVYNSEGNFPFGLEKTKLPYFGRTEGDKDRFGERCEGVQISITDLVINFDC